MRIWAITDRGVVRQENQDGYAVCRGGDDQVCAMVCDGMGGAKAGNVASALALESMQSALAGRDPAQWGEDPAGFLTECVARANQTVFHRAVTDLDCTGMGTTLVAALVLGEMAYILNVGDSRAYLIREGEGIRQITRDHSLVEDMVLRGELSLEQAKSHPRKNLITKALGVMPEVACDIYEQPLGTGDRLLLCSDGLSNQMDDQEISYEVLYGAPAEGCCQRLLQLAIERGAPDNVTVVLLEK